MNPWVTTGLFKLFGKMRLRGRMVAHLHGKDEVERENGCTRGLKRVKDSNKGLIIS